MRFAILKCAGYEKIYQPGKHLVDNMLQPFLFERGWDVVGFILVDKLATFLALEEREDATNLSQVLSSFVEFVKEKGLSPAYKEEFPYLCFAKIEIVSSMASTERDADIFSALALQAQLEAIPLTLREVREELNYFAKKLGA